MMSNLKTAALTINLLVITGSSAAYVDYSSNGANWPNKGECEGPNQSPIDLNYENVPIFDASEDGFKKHYENVVPDGRVTDAAKARTKVSWDNDKSTLYVKYDNAKPKLNNWYFKSNFSKNYYFGPSEFFG